MIFGDAVGAFPCGEERCQTVTTHHAKHDNQAVASPEEGTSRALDQKPPEESERAEATPWLSW